MKTSIIICSRTESSRLPGKALLNICGIPIIQHLINRIKNTFEIILAVPYGQKNKYSHITDCKIVEGCADKPLTRMYEIAKKEKLDHIIRITHDKIFIDKDTLKNAYAAHINNHSDYTYLTGETKGIGFEIVSFACLEKAYNEVKNSTEHLSYYFRACSKSILPYNIPQEHDTNVSLLIDYPEDFSLINTLLSLLGKNASTSEVINYLNLYEEMKLINRRPWVTIYTCVRNGIEHINNCLDSIIEQTRSIMPGYIQTIIIDDDSTDGTLEVIARRSILNGFSWFKNYSNIGLAASSNIALKTSKADYIIRLDADDTFINEKSVLDLYHYTKKHGYDVVYPAYLENGQKIIDPKIKHHAGGAMFKRASLNAIRFNDNLRHYEGLDLFERAHKLLHIGYYMQPIFNYTVRSGSMSNSCYEEREIIKRTIYETHEQRNEIHQ